MYIIVYLSAAIPLLKLLYSLDLKIGWIFFHKNNLMVVLNEPRIILIVYNWINKLLLPSKGFIATPTYYVQAFSFLFVFQDPFDFLRYDE